MTDIVDILTIKNVFRVLIFVILFGYNLFSLVLMFRIGILADTLKTKRSVFVSLLSKAHFLMVLVGSILVAFMILF
jgi:hypothetical protein